MMLSYLNYIVKCGKVSIECMVYYSDLDDIYREKSIWVKYNLT